MPIQEFTVGDCYAHEEVFQSLGVGNAGGIRPARSPSGQLDRLVIMTSYREARIAQENPYHDRIEADTLVFTAAGRAGDQTLSGINARLIEQIDSVLPVYAFVNIGHRRRSERERWRFLGLVQYQRHFKEIQIDSSHRTRTVWVIEFRIPSVAKAVDIRHEKTLAATVALEAGTPTIDDREVVRRASDLAESGAHDDLVIESTRRRLLGLSPVDFEGTIKQILEHNGLAEVTLTPASGDGGIDVNAWSGPALWPLGRLRLQVQAKRWLHSVGRREVAELRGSLEPHARGLLISTSYFTRAAILESSLTARAPITLVDGWDFSRHCLASGLVLPS